MSTALPEAKRIYKRIWLTFILAIILPSALLGYFGFSAIQNLEGVVKKGIEDNHLQVARFVYGDLKEQILSREAKIRRDVNIYLPERYDRQQLSQVMDRLRLLHKTVKESFLLTDRGRLLYPLEIAPSTADSTALAQVPRTVPPEEFRKHMKIEEIYNEARQLEFSQNSPETAIEKYRTVADNELNPRLAAEAGFAIGRCHAKMGRQKDAAEAYRKLFSVSGSERLMAGLPVSLEARIGAARARVATGQIEEGIALLLAAYRSVLDYEYPLTLDEFGLVSRRLRQELDSLGNGEQFSAGDRAQYDSIKELEGLRLSQDRYARVIESAFLPQLLEAFESPASKTQTGRHLSADVAGEKVTVMFFFPFTLGEAGGRAVRYMYGCVLNTDYIGEITKELVSQRRFEEGLFVAVSSGDQVLAVTPQAPESFRASLEKHRNLLSAQLQFKEILPHWEIGVYYMNMESLERSIRIRLVSHVITVALLIVVIVFGVFFSLRGISREIELAKMKSDFVSNVSHELKTPLTSIRMFAEMLKNRRVRSREKEQEYLELMTAESERLSRLIGNVLDFAKVEEGRKEYRFEPLDACALMMEAVQIIQPHVTQQGFKMETEPCGESLPILGDKDSLEQVLLNILNNAVKYSGERKEITARAYANATEAVIEIEDRGIGIPEEDLSKIFDKFYRADTRAGYQSTGTGLGLTLARQIVEAHKGRIEVKSSLGEGSTFSIMLPLAKSQENERSTQP